MQSLSDLLTFFGRFHTLVVHLPIGFLFIAVLLEVITRWRAFRKHEPLVPFMWLLGAMSVCIAVVLGYMLSLAGDYDEERLAWHKWAGIALCVLSFVCYYFKARLNSARIKMIRNVYIGLVILTSSLLIQTGHLGGTLTHGPDYLVEYAPPVIRKLAGMDEKTSTVQKRIVSLDSADIFHDAVMPIISSKCSSCHNENKKKGKLVLSSFADIIAGGETAPGVVPGNLARSEIYRRITLPEDHEDFMPGEGKTPLSEEQISIIEWWIEKDAPPNGIIGGLSPNENMVQVFETFFGLNKDLEVNVSPADPNLLASLFKKGYTVKKLSSVSNFLEVKVRDKDFSKADIPALLGVKDQLAWLDLSNSGISDEDLKSIGALSNLTKLNLQGNNISDHGVQYLLSLSKLEYLNLYRTKVTDRSIMHFATLEKLKRLYLWDTGVTNDALVDSLTNHKPGLTVIYELPFGAWEKLESMCFHFRA